MSVYPVGTVTFLFTDIEGSTRRWDQFPEAMSVALARHDALLRTAIERHDGHVFKTIGDAFCAAFATATDALDAALDAQLEIQAETWGEVGPIRVRMALHTGAAEERDGDYFGPPLNRVARVLSTGYGAQTLLSQTTYDLVRDSLPAGVSLLDMGDHRLKDLQRPERIHQAVHPLLPAEFPPLKSLDSKPNNLPAQPTAIIDRVRELAMALELLRSPQVRVLTFTGPGGAGKTRLALQTGADLLDDFAHGVYFVSLSPITEPDRIAPAIAQALGIPEGAGQTVFRDVAEYLHDRRLLLILDNFEQVVDGAPVVAELLAACPGVKVLNTSRATLRIRGERELPVPPLSLPNVQRLPPPERLSQYGAVALFIERAQAVRPDFAVTNENAPAVAEICWRLDGLPLAIELAAARSKLLLPQAMLARLERRLPLLVGGARDLPARQQTLRNAIAWSWDLLTAEERSLFQRMSAFIDGSSLEASAAVCADDPELDRPDADLLTYLPPPELEDGLLSLINNSLMRQEEIVLAGGVTETRLVMLSTIREYAQERLVKSGDEGTIQRRHAAYYLALAEAAQPRLGEDRQAEWLDRLEHENENFRAALTWLE
ncbi:MAG: AAA family ATPase, partial [Chloroflexi bacterium]|nr:AAA family ATPase [Chloroflexota bacterium]